MNIKVHQFFTQKLGNDIKDYEDAFAPKIEGEKEYQSFCCAISDGASESSFASDWAKMLTRTFVKNPISDVETLKNVSEELGQRWQKNVHRLPLPWFAEEKVKLGAFATLFGVEFFSSKTWNATTIGDSCLFQIRNDELISALPISKSEEFSNSPILLSSNSIKNHNLWDKVLFQKGEWEINDSFFLMTDAISHWFLLQCEIGERPWKIIYGFTEKKASQSFLEWINSLRSNLQIKNDDVTIISIQF